MPVSVAVAVEEAAEAAVAKARAARHLPRYLVSSALAGAYVGVAIVLLVSTAGPLAATGSPATKLVSGCVFGIALTLVVFAGAELFTGNNMTMTIGWMRKRVRGADALAVNVISLVGNLIGSVALAALVYGSGVLHGGAKPGKPAPGEGMIASVVATKTAASDGQLFWRAVLCNMLVCLALWMAARASSDSAKLICLFWGLLAFIASGFEHCVANMTVFSLGVFTGSAEWGDLGHNLLYTIPGNVVGGALLVAVPYVLTAGPPPAVRAAVPAAVPAAAPAMAPAFVGSNGHRPVEPAPEPLAVRGVTVRGRRARV